MSTFKVPIQGGNPADDFVLQDGVRFSEVHSGKTSNGGDDQGCFEFALHAENKGFRFMDRKDTSGIVLHIADQLLGETDAQSGKRLNAQYHLPPFMLATKFPGIKAIGLWKWLMSKPK